MAQPAHSSRQVWNRQRGDREPTQEVLPGLLQVRRLTAATQWAISPKPSQPGLVSDKDFIAAQAINTRTRSADGTKRTYLLVGLLRCGLCGRSLESQWSHGNPCYRCRHGFTTAHLPAARRLPNLHLRQDVILARAFLHLQQISTRDPQIQHYLVNVRQSNEPVDWPGSYTPMRSRLSAATGRHT